MKSFFMNLAISCLAVSGCSTSKDANSTDPKGKIINLKEVRISTRRSDGCKLNEQTHEPITGTLVNYAANGQMILKAELKDGHFNGETLEWYENGQMKRKGTLRNGSSSFGEHLFWHPNGQLQSKETWLDGTATEMRQCWYEDGQMRWSMTEINGKQHGISRSWHKNGQLESRIEFNHGVIVKAEKWDQNGNPK